MEVLWHLFLNAHAEKLGILCDTLMPYLAASAFFRRYISWLPLFSKSILPCTKTKDALQMLAVASGDNHADKITI